MTAKACAFTGHRPNKLPWRYDETDSRCVALEAVLAEQIAALADGGVTDFLNGMDEGIDLICAEVVLAQREKNPALKLHCFLPYMGQDARWTDSARQRYRSIIRRADSKMCVSREYHTGCMRERSKYLVEHSDCLLAVYDKTKRGLTAVTVYYAHRLHREIIVIDPNTLCISREGNVSGPARP